MAAEPITILGGSSAFLPDLAACLCDAVADLPPLDVCLFGRNPERARLVAEFCTRYAQQRGVAHGYSWTCSLEEALAGARIVVNQIRVGGFDGRSFDETLPLSVGLPGDETIGPGGLASAVRGWPTILQVARAIERLAPDAVLVHMSNPMGILLRALSRTVRLRMFGLCELPAHTLCTALSLIDEDAADADYLGVNHQGWFTRIHAGERDLLPAIHDAIERTTTSFFAVDVEIMRELGVLPLPYMRLYYHTLREVRAARERDQTRGAQLDAIGQRLYAEYARGGTRLPSLLAERAMPWNRIALVPALSALLGGTPARLYVSEPNRGHIARLPDDAIVEKAVTLSAPATVTQPWHCDPNTSAAAAPLLDLLVRIERFEELATRAAVEHSPIHACLALAAHPFGIPEHACAALADRIFDRVPEPEAAS